MNSSGSNGTNGRFHIVYYNTFKFSKSGRDAKWKHVGFHPIPIECIVFVGQLAAVVAFIALHMGDNRIYIGTVYTHHNGSEDEQ